MNKRGLFVGLIFIFIGLAGLLVTNIYYHYKIVPQARNKSFSKGLSKRQEEGKLIYYFGINSEGRRIPFSLRGMHSKMRGRMNIGCVKCHGRDGKGGLRLGGARSADIRWKTLKKKGYDFYKFSNAVRKGKDEDGDELNPYMPRWRIRAQELISLKAYLEIL